MTRLRKKGKINNELNMYLNDLKTNTGDDKKENNSDININNNDNNNDGFDDFDIERELAALSTV